MVLVPKKDKLKIYLYLLQEGVFCCKKANTMKNEILDIPNIYCFLVMRSLQSRKFVNEIFSWQWHYYFLTKEGVEYLRNYLGMPANVVPKTHNFENAEPNEEEKEEQEGGDDDRRRGRRGGRGRGGRGRGRGRQEGQEAEGEPEAQEV
ncbi:MAG: hypothetical protein MJ252_28435 [archaeon]|nr:hypothetical protein [archaeon]